jgi:hypothetical protein
LKGNVSSTGSGSNGIAVQSGSTLEIRGASVQASNNGGGGIDIVDSQAIIFGYPESQGSIVTADDNGSDGIFVATGSLSFFGGAFAGTGSLATISASNNGGSGIAIGLDGAVVSSFGAAKFIIENTQQIGLNVGEGGGPAHRRINGAEQSDRPAGGWCRDPDSRLGLVESVEHPK